MLTVLMATRNRSRILRDVLEAFCHLERPSSGWKLVVIDNGSMDQTSEVIASFTNRLPLQSACEPNPGKNSALNTGLALVEGDLTVFTDDDVFPHADWLVQLRKVADTQIKHSMFGGKIVPRWEEPPPPWVQWLQEGLRPGSVGWADQAIVYTLTDPSLTEGPIAPYLIFGPNMAIRTSVFQSGARLDSSIGPRGSSYPMGSETELVNRLSREGHTGWYAARAVVEHFIRKGQLNKAWVMQRAINFGRGQFHLNPEAERIANGKSWMSARCALWAGDGPPPRLLFKILEQGLLVTAGRLFLQDEALFQARWRFNFLYGQAIEARLLARGRSLRARPA